MPPTTPQVTSVNVGTAQSPIWQTNGINTTVAAPVAPINPIPTAPQAVNPTIPQGNIPIGATTGQPMAIPQQPVSTLAVGTSAYYQADAQAQQQALLAQQQQQMQQQQSAATQSKNTLDSAYNQLFNFPQKEQQIYDAAGITQKQQQVTQYSNQLNALKQSEAAQIATLQNNAAATGMSSGALANQIARIQRQSAIDQSTVAVSLSATSNDLQGAQAAADRKIKLELEPLETQLDYAKQLYTDNKNDLSKSEDKLWSAQISQLDDKLKEEQANKKQISDIAIDAGQNGASQAQVQKILAAPTPGEAAQLAGKNSSAYLDRQVKQANIAQSKASTANIYSEIKARNIANQQAADDNSPSSLAQQLVSGNLAPDQLTKRTKDYSAVLEQADKLSLAQTGKHFDIAQASRDYKYATNINTQNTLNYLGSLVGTNGTPGNLDELKTLSDSVSRTKFPAINNANAWAKLQSGDPTITAYYATVTEVSDQIAKILQGGGTGSGTSDAKLAQAAQLFNKKFSKAQIESTINAIKPLLMNRGKSIVKDNPYLSDYADSFGFSDKTNSQTSGTLSSGITWHVEQ